MLLYILLSVLPLFAQAALSSVWSTFRRPKPPQRYIGVNIPEASDVPLYSDPLVNFQVGQPPPIVKSNARKCTVQLVRHNFANSYYHPAIAHYEPLTACGEVGTWGGIVLNYTATSIGRQYDRLSTVTVHNVEVWRTSTAEPTRNPGIIWTALKDVSRYTALFSKPGTLILDLNNVIDLSAGLDGQYNVTLSVTFYASNIDHPPAQTASEIIPLSNLSPDQANYVAVPPSLDTIVKLPKNTASAVAEIYASGNANDEFWYLNVPDNSLALFPPGSVMGKGSFREVRLLVDGKLAGIAHPYPVIFTGGILPSLWRPIIAYGAFDQPTYNIDLTPFVPLLSDGNPHIVSIDVVSSEPDMAINDNWLVSGNIQVILDSSSEQTTGRITSYLVSPSSSSAMSTDSGNLTIDIKSTHQLRIEADITTGGTHASHIIWEQDMSFSNVQTYVGKGTSQTMLQLSSGLSTSMHDGNTLLRDQFSYPLAINLTGLKEGGDHGFYVTIQQGFGRILLHSSLAVPEHSQISTTQNSNGTFISTRNGSYRGNGTTSQSFDYLDWIGNKYSRKVAATNSRVTSDTESGSSPYPWSLTWQTASGTESGFVGRLLAFKRKVAIW